MAKSPHELVGMSDEELMQYTLSGEADSYVHRIGETALTLRYAQRTAEAAQQQATDARAAVKATRDVAKYTLWVAIGTAVVALATFVTVVAARWG
jgi:hypothetical protein